MAMKRTLLYLTTTALSLLLVQPGTLIAQVDETGDGAERREPPDQPKPSRVDEADPTSDENGPRVTQPQARRHASPVRRQIVRLKKLQVAMRKKLSLSRKQVEAVDGLFNDYTSRLKDERQRRSDSEEAPEIVALRDAVRQALEDGDREDVRRARMALAEKLRANSGGVSDPTSEFIEELAGQLEEDQQEGFRRLVLRMGIGQSREPPGMRLKRLSRAVLRPDMDLTREQQGAIRVIIRNGLSSLTKAGGNAEQMREITEGIRAELFKELTPEQVAKAKASLEVTGKRGPRRQGGDAIRDSRPMDGHDEHREQPDRDSQDDDDEEAPDDGGGGE